MTWRGLNLSLVGDFQRSATPGCPDVVSVGDGLRSLMFLLSSMVRFGLLSRMAGSRSVLMEAAVPMAVVIKVPRVLDCDATLP